MEVIFTQTRKTLYVHDNKFNYITEGKKVTLTWAKEWMEEFGRNLEGATIKLVFPIWKWEIWSITAGDRDGAREEWSMERLFSYFCFLWQDLPKHVCWQEQSRRQRETEEQEDWSLGLVGEVRIHTTYQHLFLCVSKHTHIC